MEQKKEKGLRIRSCLTGTAGLHRAGEGRRPRRAGSQLLQPQREPAGGGAAALVRPAGELTVPRKARSWKSFPGRLANAHTAFNVCCALLWLPFLPWMVRLVCALVSEKEKK